MTRTAKDLADADLDQATGGGEYLAPGVYVEEVSHHATAGLRSDGDLVQAVSDPMVRTAAKRVPSRD